MVILDTNIIIDHLRRKEKSLLEKISQKIETENLSISAITIQELYSGKSTKEPRNEEHLLATIAPLKILPYTFEIAKLASEIVRDLKRPIELADAAITATTIVNGGELFTLDRKDFVGIANLHFYTP